MLTKDAKKVLYILYKEYSDRRKHGLESILSETSLLLRPFTNNFYQIGILMILKKFFEN